MYMNSYIINYILFLKFIYLILIILIIISKIANKFNINIIDFKNDGIIYIKNLISLLYIITMSIFIIALFGIKEKQIIIKGEEKKLLYLFGIVLAIDTVRDLLDTYIS